jgi:hypothetical protein
MAHMMFRKDYARTAVQMQAEVHYRLQIRMHGHFEHVLKQTPLSNQWRILHMCSCAMHRNPHYTGIKNQR